MWPFDRSKKAAIEREFRLSEKRMRLIESQARDLARQRAMIARLAELLLTHGDCPCRDVVLALLAEAGPELGTVQPPPLALAGHGSNWPVGLQPIIATTSVGANGQ
jgi:hypothetical protein